MSDLQTSKADTFAMLSRVTHTHLQWRPDGALRRRARGDDVQQRRQRRRDGGDDRRGPAHPRDQQDERRWQRRALH
eukprot:11391532-Alexandrium_andersonii.AAC.1